MGALISSGFTAILTFFSKFLEKVVLHMVAKWNWKIAALTFYIAATATALGTMYLAAGSFLGHFVTALPEGFFKGFCYMIVTPNLPFCLATFASAHLAVKAYQWFVYQRQLFEALVSIG